MHTTPVDKWLRATRCGFDVLFDLQHADMGVTCVGNIIRATIKDGPRVNIQPKTLKRVLACVGGIIAATVCDVNKLQVTTCCLTYSMLTWALHVWGTSKELPKTLTNFD